MIGLTLLVTSGVRGLLGRWTRVGAGLVLAPGLLAAGQFSTWLGALLVGALLVWRLPTVRVSALRFAPIMGIAVLAGAPALLGRFRDFSGGELPQSWLVRWDNVTHLFLPHLVENGRFLVSITELDRRPTRHLARHRLPRVRISSVPMGWRGAAAGRLHRAVLDCAVADPSAQFADRRCRCMRIRPQRRLVDGLGLVADGSAPVHAGGGRPALHAHCHRDRSSG